MEGTDVTHSGLIIVAKACPYAHGISATYQIIAGATYYISKEIPKGNLLHRNKGL
jgi:hypothetical protein